MAPRTLQSVCLSNEEMNQLCSGLTKGAQSIHISKCHPETHLLQLHGRSRHISVPLTDQDIRKPTSKQKPKNMQQTQKKDMAFILKFILKQNSFSSPSWQLLTLCTDSVVVLFAFMFHLKGLKFHDLLIEDSNLLAAE